MSAKVVQKMVRWSEVNKRVSPSVGLPIARRALRCAARLMLRSLHLFFSLPTILHALALPSPFKHSSWSPKSCIVILIPDLFISSMDASLPYFSAIDDYSLFNMYKHTALKTYSPFLRNEDFLHPGSHGDMENMNSLITMSNHHANSPANKLIHSSSAAFHCYQGLKQKRGVSSEDARTEALSDLCDINGFPAETKDRDAAVEIIIPSDGSIHGCFERHYNNCTDGNIWASSSSGQISVALTEFDIRKGKKRSFVRNESKNTAKEGQTKRPSSSKKGKSPSTQKAAGSPANVKKINAEPPKDFIHVRARRGQATDSHSLAERVRREKINERLRFLKNLVPGCSKTVGKAGMLEEIINYVQSLQRQIEFLSMKLAAVSPPYDFSDELNSSSKEPLSQQPGVADGGGVLVPSFSFDSKRAFTASRGETP